MKTPMSKLEDTGWKGVFNITMPGAGKLEFRKDSSLPLIGKEIIETMSYLSDKCFHFKIIKPLHEIFTTIFFTFLHSTTTKYNNGC